MRRFFASLLLISLILISLSGCATRQNLNEISYVDESDPWYDTVKLDPYSEINSGFIGGSGVVNSRDDYFVRSCSSYEPHEDEYFEVLNYSGELLYRFETGITGERVEYTAYSFGGDDYFIARIYENFSENLYLYKADYEAGTMQYIKELDFDGLLEGYISVSDVAICDGYIVYLLHGQVIGDYDSDCCFYVENTDTNESYAVPFSEENYSYCELYWQMRSAQECSGEIFYRAVRDMDYGLYAFNPESGSVREVRSLENDSDPFFLSDGTYLCRDEISVNRYDTQTGEFIEEVFNAGQSGISPYYYHNLSVEAYSGNAIVLRGFELVNSRNLQKNFQYLFTKADTNPHAGKQIVTVGFDSNIDTVFGNLIEKNNCDYSSNYFIKTVDTYFLSYTGSEEWEEAKVTVNDMLIRDVRSGDAPDIFVGGAEYCAANPGLIYADLNPFIEADGDISREDFSTAVFDAFEIDGALYNMPFAIYINGLGITASKFDGNGFTYDEYVEFINSHAGGRDTFADLEDWEYFSMLFNTCSTDFIEDGEFSISGNERFIALINFVKNRHDLYHDEPGDRIAVNYSGARNFFWYLGESKCVDIVGYPSFDGRSAPIDPSMSVAITKCCSDKDAAWQIISDLFSYEIQSVPSDCIPVRIDALIDSCNAMSEVAMNSQLISREITEEEVNEFTEEFIDIVTNLNCASYADPMVLKILREEIPAYFEDQKSLEQVMEIVENRVNNYLQEIT